MIIDERYNHGGQVADYIVNELDRKLMGYFAQRDGQPATSPIAGIYGPKVMIINESAGSGGDALTSGLPADFGPFPVWGDTAPPSLEDYLRKSLKVTKPPLTSVTYSNMA